MVCDQSQDDAATVNRMLEKKIISGLRYEERSRSSHRTEKSP